MTPRANYRSTEIPNTPGVYLFRDRFRTTIYIGKAKSLRKRLSQYFQPSRLRTADPKLRSLIHSIGYYEIFPVRNEDEAVMLESQLIKQYTPRYNVLLRDDKRFLLIKLDVKAPYPRITLARIRKDDGCLYYGPFPQVGALRATVDYLTQYFGLRSCTPAVPNETDHQHCLDRIIRHCSQPCVHKINQTDYQEIVRRLIDVLEGNIGELIVSLETKMAERAAARQYESAAKIRDMVDNIRTIFGTRNRSFVRTSGTRYQGQSAVHDLQQAIGMSTAPEVIECFDMSNISGSFAVGSMVRFHGGMPAKKEYRHYRIKGIDHANDVAMMKEVISRRYQRLIAEGKPLPDLVMVDGGRGQLNAAKEVLDSLHLGHLPFIGLAKKNEEIYLPNVPDPIWLERYDDALRLLQAIRDEAHRFANTFHRELRRKRIQNSVLDEIPGIGKKRRDALLRAFGSLRNLRAHDADEIANRLPGVGKTLAAEIVAHLHRQGKSPRDTTLLPLQVSGATTGEGET